jgi:hypothetical protein
VSAAAAAARIGCPIVSKAMPRWLLVVCLLGGGGFASCGGCMCASVVRVRWRGTEVRAVCAAAKPGTDALAVERDAHARGLSVTVREPRPLATPPRRANLLIWAPPGRTFCDVEYEGGLVTAASATFMDLGCSGDQIGRCVVASLRRCVAGEEWRVMASGALPLHPRRGRCPLHPQQGYAPCTAAENPGSATLGSLHSPDPLCEQCETTCLATRSMGAACSRVCLTACAPVAAQACTRDDTVGARGSVGSQRCTIVHQVRLRVTHGSAGSLAHLCIGGGHGAGRS